MKTLPSMSLGLYLFLVCGEISSQQLKLNDITVYDQMVTWNEAKILCEQRGLTMLTLDSQGKLDSLTEILLQEGISMLTGDYWMGLHDVEAGGTTNFYWGDCRPLTNSDWSRWDSVGNEPDNPVTQRCIRIFYGKWRTVDCNIVRRYICETWRDSCFYQTMNNTAVQQTSSILFLEMAADIDSCQAICNNMYSTNTSCWGLVASSNDTSSCSLAMTREPPVIVTVQGSNLYVKNCMKVTVNNKTETVQSSPETYPVSSCPEVTQPNTENARTSGLSCISYILNSSVTADHSNITTTVQTSNFNEEDFLHSLQLMKINLTVNKSETSSEIRKKISVYEGRSSAVSMGVIGTVVIVTIVSCPIVSDIASFLKRRGKRKAYPQNEK